jgi:hypothetical protein
LQLIIVVFVASILISIFEPLQGLVAILPGTVRIAFE